MPDGKGKYLFENGDVFLGYWQNGQKDGKGKFEYSSNGKKYTLIGYWKNDEYEGVTEPDVSYRVTSASGILDYKLEKKEVAVESDREITVSVKSAFIDISPSDLKIEISSGKIVQTGRKIGVYQYSCPLHCEISYSILLGESRKQCRFIVDILKEGKYAIVLAND